MKAIPDMRRAILQACASSACLALWLGACGGSTAGTPVVGSESHFLARCTESCGGGLDCIGGVCTRACAGSDDSCRDLASNAACIDRSSEPGAECDIPCAGAADCVELGNGAACDASFCRTTVAQSSGNTDSSSDTNGSSDTDGTGLGEAECAPYLDQSGPPVVRGVTILNRGSTRVYIRPYFETCGDNASLVGVERAGALINIWGSGCAKACQSVVSDGWTSSSVDQPDFEGSIVRFCPEGPCPDINPPVALEPGATLFEAARLEFTPQRLPRGCAEGIITDAVNCYSQVIPQPGSYTLHVDVVPTPDCTAPDCTVTTFSQPANWFFDDQTIEVELTAP